MNRVVKCIVVPSKEQRDEFQSRIYQLWAAVLNGQDKDLDVSGIINAFDGNHHMTKLKAKYFDQFIEFMEYIVVNPHKGNITKLASSLVNWFDPLKKIIKESPKGQLKENIDKYIEQDDLVLKIRKHIGLVKHDGVPLNQTESKEKSSRQKTKPIKTPSMQKIFIDALMAYIDEDDERAQILYEQAEKMGYNESENKHKLGKEESDLEGLSLEDNIKNSIFTNTLVFYKVKYPHKVLKYVSKMVGLGNSYAQSELAAYYMIPQYVKKQDYNEAIRLLKLAVAQGNPNGQYSLGLCYKDGTVVSQSDKEAARLYGLSAKQGYSDAQLNLGTCYMNGAGVDKNEAAAAKLYGLAAAQGNSAARYNLGNCYMDGLGVNENKLEAVRLYRLAGEQGNLDAIANLGVCYMNSIGTAQDKQEAVRWYKLGVEQGDSFSQFQLADCYMEGIVVEKEGQKIVVVEKNEQEAVRLYKLAIAQDDSNAMFNLAMYYGRGTDGQKPNIDEAVRYLKLAVEHYNPNAQYQLANCYMTGRGVIKDEQEAAKLYALATEQGYLNAKKPLTSIIEAKIKVDHILASKLSEMPREKILGLIKKLEASHKECNKYIEQADIRLSKKINDSHDEIEKILKDLKSEGKKPPSVSNPKVGKSLQPGKTSSQHEPK